jgi:hypothetical protein
MGISGSEKSEVNFRAVQFQVTYSVRVIERKHELED